MIRRRRFSHTYKNVVLLMKITKEFIVSATTVFLSTKQKHKSCKNIQEATHFQQPNSFSIVYTNTIIVFILVVFQMYFSVCYMLQTTPSRSFHNVISRGWAWCQTAIICVHHQRVGHNHHLLQPHLPPFQKTNTYYSSSMDPKRAPVKCEKLEMIASGTLT